MMIIFYSVQPTEQTERTGARERSLEKKSVAFTNHGGIGALRFTTALRVGRFPAFPSPRRPGIRVPRQSQPRKVP